MQKRGFVLLLFAFWGVVQADDIAFRAPWFLPTFYGSTQLASADFNHDGHVDFAVANNHENVVQILLSAGGTDFPISQTIPVGEHPVSLVSGDFNGDAYPDLAITSSSNRSLSLLLNTNGNLSIANQFNFPKTPVSLVSADFNKDGISDIGIAVQEGASGAVIIYLGDRSGTIVKTSQVSVHGPSAIVTEDFNGDGRLDLAVADYYDGVVLIYRGDGTGSFTFSNKVDAVNGAIALDAADYDGDGKPDIAVAGYYGKLAILSDKTGKLAKTQEFSLLPGRAVLTHGNINRNGRPDLIVAPEAGRMLIYIGRSGGVRFSRHLDVGSSGGIVAADVDGDGKVDLAATGYVCVAVLKGNGNGTFHQARHYLGRRYAERIVVDDFNRDGRPDILFGPPVTVLLGARSGKFSLHETKLPGSPILSADFNGDHIADLLLVTDLYYLTVAIGSGDGTFQPTEAIDPGVEPDMMQVSDLNHDGVVDIVVAGFHGAVQLIGKGDGRFKKPLKIVKRELDTSSLAIADLNGDLIPDLLLAQSSGQLFFLFGKGDGTFLPTRKLTTDDFYTSLAVLDVNGDHQNDVIAGSVEGGTYLFINSGDGSFSEHPNMILGSTAITYSLLLGDFNGDSVIDVVAAGGDRSLTLLLGNQLAAPYFTKSGTFLGYATAVADFDKDGFPDLVGGGEGISVILNTAQTVVDVQ